MKIVEKPWGKEIWFCLTDKYCLKRILVRAGCRTSLQYHEQKLETSVVLSGTGQVLLERDDGVMIHRDVRLHDSWTVEPYKKHRVIAITDLEFIEVSTPEVDDLVRVEDDTGRK